MIGNICRQYRLEKGASLASLASDNVNYQTLYSFETNKSTNFNHIKPYIKLAESYGEVDLLLSRMTRGLV